MIRIKRILCPVDFFPASEKAVNYAAGLAAIYGAKVYLLHAITPAIPTAYEFPMNTVAITKSMQEASAREMKKLETKLKPKGVDIEMLIRTGTVRDVITSEIARLKPDLISMGTHGRTGIDRWFLGSETEWVMRHSPVPVLALSPKDRLREPAFRRILVTTDFSEGTADALEYAFSIGQENKSRITLLHVISDIAVDMHSREHDSIIAGVQRKLENFVPNEVRKRCDVRAKIEVGHPYLVIESTIKMEKPDLLVMNIHGKGMLDRALLGSTAERVLRAAKCPVLMIPPMKRAARKPKKRAA